MADKGITPKQLKKVLGDPLMPKNGKPMSREEMEIMHDEVIMSVARKIGDSLGVDLVEEAKLYLLLSKYL